MQLSYSMNMAAAIAGTLYDDSPKVVDSLLAEGTIGLGMGVIAGTNPQTQAIVPSATFSAGFKGVAMYQVKEQNDDGTVTYTAKDTVPVVRKGRVWVNVTGAVTAETPAFLTFSGDDAGKWAGVAGTGPLAVAVTGAKFITSTTAAGLAVVELA